MCCRWRARLHTSAEGLPTVIHSRMDLPVIPCSGHCHLFARFICSLCFYSYHERSLDQAMILLCVCKSSRRMGVQFHFGTNRDHFYFQACLLLLSTANQTLSSLSAVGEMFLLVLHGNRAHSSPTCIFTTCTTAVLPFWCDAVIMFNHLLS